VSRTPEQEQILSQLSGALRIAAGAGTGKTDTLRLAIVELIERGARPGQILCLTFTVDATEEMRRRVLDHFRAREDIDADEITPSLKVKRKMIDKKYKDIIDKLYSDEGMDDEREAKHA
jgi:ATP-dependent exoDNAse (exonuclease V) beta subunit